MMLSLPTEIAEQRDDEPYHRPLPDWWARVRLALVIAYGFSLLGVVYLIVSMILKTVCR